MKVANKLSQSCVKMSLLPETRSLVSLTFDETKPAIGTHLTRRPTAFDDNMKVDLPGNLSEICAGRIDEQTVGSSVPEVTSRRCIPFVGHQNGQTVRKRKRRNQRRQCFDVHNARTQPYKRGISPCERPTTIKKCKLDETVTAKILVILAQVGQPGLTDAQVSSLTMALLNATYDRNVTFKPRIYNAGYNHGRYELFGADLETLNWATSIIPNLKGLWEEANIHITYAGPIPNLTKATILIPGDPVAPETFFAQINWLNEDVNTSMWRILSRNKPRKDGEIICFGIDNDSLSVLAKKDFKLFFGIGCLSIRLCKNQ